MRFRLTKWNLVKGAALLTIVALFYFGVISTSWVRQRTRPITAPIENLINSARGKPRASSIVTASDVQCATNCRANLRRIETAKRAYRVRQPAATGTYSWGDLRSDLGGRPSCPCGGTYTIGGTGTLPSCSTGNRGNTDPTDDHILRQY